MGRQRNFKQQVEDRRTQILELALGFHEHPDRYPWLTKLVNRLPPESRNGMLVELRSIPDQGCWAHYGVWLTDSGRFIKFSADESYGRRALDSSGELEDWQIEDVTDTISTAESIPGTGRSFGALALDVLQNVGSRAGGVGQKMSRSDSR